MMFPDCPAYLGDERTVRCGLPAEVRRWFIMRSADGPLECAMIRCLGGQFLADIPAGPEPKVSRPSTAPAYYLGRPAWLWIGAMRTRRGRPAEAGQPTHDVTRGWEGMPPPGGARPPAPAPELPA